jgi:hypothetical protein
MKQEYSFTITLPLSDIEEAEKLLQKAKDSHRNIRISRKPDRDKHARFYLSFPFSANRPDLEFQTWFTEQQLSTWELFGPTYGRWGLT